MRVYTRRSGKAKCAMQPPPSLVQRIVSNIGLGSSSALTSVASKPTDHVVRFDSSNSFEQSSLLSQTACSDDDTATTLKHQGGSPKLIPHTIPSEDVGRLTSDQNSKKGVGLNNDGMVIDVSPSGSFVKRNIHAIDSATGKEANNLKELNSGKSTKIETATEVDAIKALVSALTFQEKKAANLDKSVKNYQRDAKTLKNEIHKLKKEKRELAALLEASEHSNNVLKSKTDTFESAYRAKVKEIAELKELLFSKQNPDGGTCVITTDIVPYSDSKRNDFGVINDLKAELEKVREENSCLRSEMKVMLADYNRSEKLHESKITILMEMKAALETQVKLLENK